MYSRYTAFFFSELTSSIMDYIISCDTTKKDNSRSLGILCQKFLMLFMVAEVCLKVFLKIVVQNKEFKFQTKVRTEQ